MVKRVDFIFRALSTNQIFEAIYIDNLTFIITNISSIKLTTLSILKFVC